MSVVGHGLLISFRGKGFASPLQLIRQLSVTSIPSALAFEPYANETPIPAYKVQRWILRLLMFAWPLCAAVKKWCRNPRNNSKSAMTLLRDPLQMALLCLFTCTRVVHQLLDTLIWLYKGSLCCKC